MASTNEYHQIILVTGANKGIGFFLIKKLVEEYSSRNTLILLGSRDLTRGKEALIQLNSPLNVHVLQLDTSSKQSILHAIDHIKLNYGGQIDILINNAGISTDDLTVDSARQVFQTNYYGVKMMNEYFLPLIKQNGRIVNVSSRTGTIALEESSLIIQQKYTSTDLTEDQLDQLVEDFISAIQSNTLEDLGYNLQSNLLVYAISKAAVNALTQIEARQWSKMKNLLIVSVTPGLCATDMTRNFPNTRSPELGALSIFYVIDTPVDQLQNGAFYRDGKQIPLINQSFQTK